MTMENTNLIFNVIVHCDNFDVSIPNAYNVSCTPWGQLTIECINDEKQYMYTFAEGKWLYYTSCQQ